MTVEVRAAMACFQQQYQPRAPSIVGSALRLIARWLNSIRSDSVSSIVLFMSTIILPF
jgi:hypothetical protein